MLHVWVGQIKIRGGVNSNNTDTRDPCFVSPFLPSLQKRSLTDTYVSKHYLFRKENKQRGTAATRENENAILGTSTLLVGRFMHILQQTNRRQTANTTTARLPLSLHQDASSVLATAGHVVQASAVLNDGATWKGSAHATAAGALLAYAVCRSSGRTADRHLRLPPQLVTPGCTRAGRKVRRRWQIFEYDELRAKANKCRWTSSTTQDLQTQGRHNRPSISCKAGV